MTSPLPTWAAAAPVQAVLAALAAAGSEGRFVGGCVRDHLAGRPIKDIDIATPLPPEAVMEAVARAGLKSRPTGLQHGTVTAIAEGQGFEVTTLREDVETFGRHATVAFTEDWRRDAARRDLTINALFLDNQGRLHDFFAGAEDLKAGRVRFVGDPWQRIREDYLRILRFLRFHAYYARTPLDADGLAAASGLAEGLEIISGERKRDELLRLLAAPDPLPVLEAMRLGGILIQVLPQTRDLETLRRLVTLAPESDSLQRLAALLPTEAGLADQLGTSLRLSNLQRRRLRAMTAAPGEGPDLEDGKVRRSLLYHHGAEALVDCGRLAAAAQTLSPDGLGQLEREAKAWEPRKLPINGKDLEALGLPRGPKVGRFMRRLEAWWIEQDFLPARDSLLAEAERQLSEEET